jgi:heme-degrading monooxygenase HmoA
MVYVLAIQRVEDYDKWKKIFDEHGAVRKSDGSRGALIYRDSNDPKQLAVITQWDDIEAAKNFSTSDDLKNTMKRAGVMGLPKLYYLEDVEKTDY